MLVEWVQGDSEEEYKMNMFFTAFQDDHVHVGAARAGTASERTRDAELTIVSGVDVRLRQASAISWNGRNISIYFKTRLDSACPSCRATESRREPGRLIEIDRCRLPHKLTCRVQTFAEKLKWQSRCRTALRTPE
jgi:hypothetical protein